jgi:hypothetical protein
MSLYGGQDIADAARRLPRVLAAFDRSSDVFASYYRQMKQMGGPMSG